MSHSHHRRGNIVEVSTGNIKIGCVPKRTLKNDKSFPFLLLLLPRHHECTNSPPHFNFTLSLPRISRKGNPIPDSWKNFSCRKNDSRVRERKKKAGSPIHLCSTVRRPRHVLSHRGPLFLSVKDCAVGLSPQSPWKRVPNGLVLVCSRVQPIYLLQAHTHMSY